MVYSTRNTIDTIYAGVPVARNRMHRENSCYVRRAFSTLAAVVSRDLSLHQSLGDRAKAVREVVGCYEFI